MLRATALSGLRHQARWGERKILVTTAVVGHSLWNTASTTTRLAVVAPSLRYNNNNCFTPRSMWTRALSSSSSSASSDKKKDPTKKQAAGDADDEEMTQEIVLTPGEKVVAGTRLTMWAAAAVFASFCAYYIGKELIPTKMSPNTVFDHAFDVVRHDPLVTRRFGEPLKAYGRDHGGHREGRRNFVEHTEWTTDDGDKRTRVRFNLEGRFGKAFVFAEVSKSMPSGEFVYVLVQDKQNGQVITVIDNRAALTAQRMAGDNTEGQKVFSDLLKGSGTK